MQSAQSTLYNLSSEKNSKDLVMHKKHSKEAGWLFYFGQHTVCG